MPPLIDQSTTLPTRKVGRSALVGAVVTLGVFVAGLFGADVTAEAAASATSVLMFLTAYFVKERA